MSAISTSYRGPLGSLIHHFRADARTVAALAVLDWPRGFGRVWLDALLGAVVLRSPSRAHDKLADVFDDIVDVAAALPDLALEKLRSTRWRGIEEPPGTGVEPDCCFYVGDRADAYRAALDEGEEAADAFVERNAPDLVVEVEITHADRTKVFRYSDLGVREFWRVRGERGRQEKRAEFLALRRGQEPEPLSVSIVLPEVTPEKAVAAIAAVQAGRNRRERTRNAERVLRHDGEGDAFLAGEERAPYVTTPLLRDEFDLPEVSTSYRGPLGSTIHHLRVDAATVTALAGLDWATGFRRVWLDPGRESVVFMEPSRLHDDLAGAFDALAEAAAKELRRSSAKLGSIRWRREGEPPDTGIEPDCSFYLGERAEGYRAASAESEAAASAFVERNAPALVVEVEMTSADEGKIARYAELGVREMWRLHTEPGTKSLRADFLSLRRGEAPRPLPASEVLPGLTPEEAGAAVETARLSRDHTERPEAAHDEPTAYRTAPAGGPVAAAGLPRDG